MTPSDLKLPDTSVCPRCGTGLRCGMVAGDAQCWCVQLPHVMPVPAISRSGEKSPRPAPAPAGKDTQPAAASSAASCYCPACLQKITDERLNAA